MAKKNVHLPEDLIVEILLRSTVKTLLRCKCVCKSWLSVISQPDFATSHFQLAASPTNKLVFVGNNYETLSIDFNASLDNESSYASLSSEFLPLRSDPEIEIGGSCRGFIFSYTYTDFFYVWNPSTGVQIKIPASPLTNVPDSYLENSDFDTFLFGFAYDHSTDDYLIVLCAFDICLPGDIFFDIFSLRANKWKHIKSDSQLIIDDGESDVGLLLNGSFHWMVCIYEDVFIDYIIEAILVFDLKESTMSQIALPYGFYEKHHPSNHNLLVLGGLISAAIVEMHTIKIWVMQKYGVHSSWTKIIEFSVDPVLPSSFSIVCFTNCGDIIGTDGEGGLLKFSDKGQLLEHHSCRKGNNRRFLRSRMVVYTESMLSLPFGTEEA